MNNYILIETNNVDQLKARFKYLALSITEIGNKFDINIKPFEDPQLKIFSEHTQESQLRIISALETYLNIHLNIINSGGSIFDSAQIVWSALKSLGYRPTIDLFGHLGPDDIVEIHNSSLFQEFRNLKFFKFCSYTIEQLYCESLHDLYERDEKIELAILDLAKNIFSGQITSTISSDFIPHYIKEKKGQKLIIEDKIKIISPLFDLNTSNKLPIGTIVFETAQLVDINKLNRPVDLNM